MLFDGVRDQARQAISRILADGRKWTLCTRRAKAKYFISNGLYWPEYACRSASINLISIGDREKDVR